LIQTEDGALAQDLLNQALKEDTLDNSYVSLNNPSYILNLLTLSQILSISVYYTSGKPDRSLVNEGQYQQVSIYYGIIKLVDILQLEVAGASSSVILGEE